MRPSAMVKSWLRSRVSPGKLPSSRAVTRYRLFERLAAGNRGRVLILGGGAGPPAADGVVSSPGLAFLDNGAVLGEERNDRIDVTFGVELEVALDDVGDVVERGLLLRLAMLSART
jgi:hypothetical protein